MTALLVTPFNIRRVSFMGALLIMVLLLALQGCVAPGYPYNGGVPQGAIPPGSGAGQNYAQPVLATQVAPGGVIAPAYPYVYAPAPVLIAPSFYGGWGNGYWYGNRFWPYRSGCAFYGGRYYGGYSHGYWRSRAVWGGGNAAYRGYGARY
jgi:hypothetical protein